MKRYRIPAEAKCKAVLWVYADSYEEALEIADHEPDNNWDIDSPPEIIEIGEPEER